MINNNQESRRTLWATRLSVRLFAHTAYSFAYSTLLVSLARSAALCCALLRSFARKVNNWLLSNQSFLNHGAPPFPAKTITPPPFPIPTLYALYAFPFRHPTDMLSFFKTSVNNVFIWRWHYEWSTVGWCIETPRGAAQRGAATEIRPRHNTVQPSAVRYMTVGHGKTRYGSVRCSPARRSYKRQQATVKHGTVEHNALQKNAFFEVESHRNKTKKYDED